VVAGSPPRRGFIRAFGLFWSAEEINWTPGAGNKGAYRILGRHGLFRPKLRICDFRSQRGIYVLYDDYGPYYVGLARDQDIGNRLRSHTRDFHRGNWDRFSWFGFRPVLKGRAPDGTHKLGKIPTRLLTDSRHTIADIEALMIQSLGTQKRANAQVMRFAAAEKWDQLMEHEIGDYLAKVRR
jgi:hypothetical protein